MAVKKRGRHKTGSSLASALFEPFCGSIFGIGLAFALFATFCGSILGISLASALFAPFCGFIFGIGLGAILAETVCYSVSCKHANTRVSRILPHFPRDA
jgi:phosphate/sulfate permease